MNLLPPDMDPENTENEGAEADAEPAGAEVNSD